MDSRTETTTRLGEFAADPFGDVFGGRSAEELVASQPLLDTPSVRRWFDLIARGTDASLYTFQLPLSRAAGPESAALGEDILMFSSYSYLGLIGHPRIAAAVQQAVDRFGTSTGGVRLLTGTLELHLEVERELAEFLGVEAAACFGSGYDANLAAISALFGPDDWALLDQYAHQSIVDGTRMAGCSMRRFRHNDMEDLERRIRQARNRGARRILIAVDSVFSMDGDQAPLAELLEIRDRHDAFLMVDEAHSIGAIGATGRGICEEQGIDPRRIDIITGSLSKAIPSSGGFIGGSRALKLFMQHGSAPYMFSAALTPANAAAILEAIRIVREEPQRVTRLRENSRILRDGLASRGFETGASTSPVVPLILGDEWRAFRWARRMLDDGIFVSAVVFPAVSPGQARLRLCSMATHRPDQFERLFDALESRRADEA